MYVALMYDFADKRTDEERVPRDKGLRMNTIIIQVLHIIGSNHVRLPAQLFFYTSPCFMIPCRPLYFNHSTACCILFIDTLHIPFYNSS